MSIFKGLFGKKTSSKKIFGLSSGYDVDDIDIKKTKQEIPEVGLNGYNVNFQAIFTHKKLQEAFGKHLKEEMNPEPFEFLLDIEKITDNSENSNVKKFFKIVNEYVKDGAEKEVNLAATTKKKLFVAISKQKEGESWKLASTPLNLLEPLRQSIHANLYVDVFPRFLKSKICYDAILSYLDDENVISKNPLYVVLYKLQNSVHRGESTPEELKEFARSLTQANLLKDDYLSLDDWEGAAKMDRKLQKKDSMIPLDIQQSLKMTQKTLNKKNLKIKIVILQKDKKLTQSQNMRELLSPILSKFQFQSNSYTFRSALMIGPWLFEWDESELCIPRKCISSAAVMSADIDSVHELTNVREIIDYLANEIEYWNTKMTYSENVESDKNISGNSQDFVESLLESINVKLSLPISIKNFLEEIKKHGSTKLNFQYSPQFKQKFDLKGTSMTFNTHKELDKFMHSIYEKDAEAMFNFKSEFQFLKSFDRAFWMKHYHIQSEIEKTERKLKKCKEEDRESIIDDIEKLKEESLKFEPDIDYEEGDLMCPFGDPVSSQSLIL
eukprot:gene5920-9750_t